MLSYNINAIKKALVECALEQYETVPAEDDIQHAFSRKFEKWAQRLIKKTKTTGFKAENYFRFRKVKMAIIIAALIAALSATAMAIPALREAILDFFLNNRGESYGITFDPEQAASAPDEIQQYNVPQYIPDGYEMIMEDKSVAAVVVAWMNDKDELISFTQRLIHKEADESNWIGVSSEGVTRSSIIVDGYKVEIVQDEFVYTAIWTDNKYLYLIELPDTLDIAVFEQILTSMTIMAE